MHSSVECFMSFVSKPLYRYIHFLNSVIFQCLLLLNKFHSMNTHVFLIESLTDAQLEYYYKEAAFFY